jgi:hypothetical protein
MSEDDPAKYAAALRLDARDFYRLVAAKRKTIQRLNGPKK